MSTLIVVDGPNVFNDAARELAGLDATFPGVVQQYFTEWFDIDRLVNATILPQTLSPFDDLGIVSFHSRKSLGSETTGPRIAGDVNISKFWTRQGGNPNSSTLLVDVPGARQGKETGIDTSTVVYLFETEARWDRAVLFTNDADFVPAVWSLRRRGKRVYCAARRGDSSSPLAAACQHFLPWDIDFLRADLQLFELLVPGGRLDRFVSDLGVESRDLRLHYSRGALVLTSKAVVARLTELQQMVEGTAFTILHSETEAAVQTFPGNRGGHVIEGLLRHIGLHREAAWQKFWRP